MTLTWAAYYDIILKVSLWVTSAGCDTHMLPDTSSITCHMKCKSDVLNRRPPLQASFQRSNSHDKVRKIVAEEGRAARNLIAWSVPLESKEEEGWWLDIKHAYMLPWQCPGLHVVACSHFKMLLQVISHSPCTTIDSHTFSLLFWHSCFAGHFSSFMASLLLQIIQWM